MKRRHLIGSLGLCMAGCAARVTAPIAVPTHPTVEQSIATLRLAVSDVKGLDDLRQDYEALRLVLAEILQTNVAFFPVNGYLEAASALRLDQVDLVLTGPSEYVVMRARTNAIPLLGIQRVRYYPVFVVRPSSDLQSIADLKGKTIAMWEVGSTSGHLGPTKMLIDAGLDPQEDVHIKFLGKEGLLSLKNGKVDAWAGAIRRYDAFLEKEKLTPQELTILAQGPSFPPDPFVMNSKYAPPVIHKTREQFMQNQGKILKAIASVGEGKFHNATLVSIDDTAFNVIREAYRATGQGTFL